MTMAALLAFDWDRIKFLLIFLAIFLPAYALAVWLWDRWKAYRTRDWTRTVATVTTVELEACTGARGVRYTEVTVRYGYQVAGEQKGYYKFQKDIRSAAEALQESLPGTDFPVRYNPAQPGDSVVLLMDRPD